jgi:hypothetical protein
VADAQYVIEIAAGMPAGDATIAELDRLTASLLGGGKNADHFQNAIKSAAASLDVAKASTLAANTALASGASEYALLETAAVQATKAAERMALKGGGMTRSYLEAAKKASEAQAAVGAYAGTLKTLEQNAAGAAAKETALATTLKNVQKLSGHANAALAAKAETLEKLRGGLASVPGPAGKMASAFLAPAQGFAKLSAGMGSANALMLLSVTAMAALAIGAVALGVAIVAATVKVAAWAVGLADAKRSAGLATEAFNAMNPALAGLPFDALTAETGQSSNALRGLAKQLTAAKVSAEDMPAALRAAALAETALGQGGASDFIERIREGKTAVRDLATEASTKLGGIVSRQMLGLDAQSARLKSGIAGVFGGLDIDPVLAGMNRLVGLFDKNSAAGQAMSFLFEKVFQPLINQADKAALVIEAFALGFLIGLTKLYIALKPAIKAVGEFFGFESTSLTDVLGMAKKAGELIAPVFAVLAVIVGVTLAGAFLSIGVIIAAQVAVWYGVVKVIGFVVDAFKAVYTYLTTTPLSQIVADMAAGFVAVFINLPGTLLGIVTNAIAGVLSYLTSIDLASIGSNMMMGLVRGITSAVSAVVGAVTNAVGAAVSAAKSALGISSPSKVFAQIGDYTGQGFAGGVEDTTDAAQAAMRAMVEPPDAPPIGLGGVASGVASPADAGASAGVASAGAAGGGAAGGGAAASTGPSLSFAGAVFHFGPGTDGKKAADDFVERLVENWERLSGQVGGEVPA